MFLSRNKKNNVYPCKPQFYYIKVVFEGSKLYRHVFVMVGPDKMSRSVASDLGLHCLPMPILRDPRQNGLFIHFFIDSNAKDYVFFHGQTDQIFTSR